MKPEWRIWRYSLPLAAPASLAPGTTMSIREGLLLEIIIEDGGSFWGEAAPLPGFSGESLDDARKCLEDEVSRFHRAENPRRSFAAVSASLASGSPSVEFALASAFESLENADGRWLGSVSDPNRRDPAGERVGGRPRSGTHVPPKHSVALCGLLSGSRDEVLSDAIELRKNGYEAVKLKVGRGDVEDDAALVREARDVLGDDFSLRLDANRAWGFEDARRFAGLISDAGIEYIEEPLADAGRLRELSEATGLPVALDESLSGMEPDEARSHHYARAFVMKPSLLGFHRTVSFASVARDRGAKAIISSSYESGVGTLALLRMADSIGDGAAGLDTYRRLADDVLSPPLELSRPRVDMREVFGVERKVDHEKLERVA
ncbi:MAG: o-succinylbenzoate synthase [Actinomycetota bacterium]|nr:o-succinylbenzoate synthase [Rubrobacter sp.]MDQ3509493.1 o-succinylbenzoate synthase [Actinomycetota bacterium]